MLYFENLSGVKEDEYLRDGITEDIITELSKIKGSERLLAHHRARLSATRPVTPARSASSSARPTLLTGSLRRAGNRLRINAQLVDAQTDFPLWSERYDREMADVFEVQDEIARKIAEALRITLTPQEQEALAPKPTENLQAYDLYLRGKSYARRRDAPGHGVRAADVRERGGARLRASRSPTPRSPTSAPSTTSTTSADPPGSSARGPRASGRAPSARTLPEVQMAQALDPVRRGSQYEDAAASAAPVIARKPDSEGAYYLLLRALFAAGRYQEVADIADVAATAARRRLQRLRPDHQRARRARQAGDAAAHPAAPDPGARGAPQEGARGRAGAHPARRRLRRRRAQPEDAMREANLAMVLRPNEATVLYNAACTFCNSSGRPRPGGAEQGLARRLPRPGLGAARPRPRDPPRRSGVRAALSREARR